MDNQDKKKNLTETVSKAATRVSEAGKDAAKKITPITSAAKEVGNDVANKLSEQEIVSKIANNETVSKIVDNQAAKKISKNKNKRIVLIGAALLVVVLVVIIASLGGGSGGSSSSGTFSSEENVRKFFENEFPNARQITIAKTPPVFLVEGRDRVEAPDGFNIQIATSNNRIYYIYALRDGRLFDYSGGGTNIREINNMRQADYK